MPNVPNRRRDYAGLAGAGSAGPPDELESARACLFDMVGRLGNDPAITIHNRGGTMGVFTATSSAALTPVVLDGAGSRAGGRFPATEVRVWPEPRLAWADSPERRATWLNRSIGLGAIQRLLDDMGDGPFLTACFELDDGLRWEREGALLLRLFASAGADWMLHRDRHAVFSRSTIGLTNWHRALANLPAHWFGSWALLRRRPGHVIVRMGGGLSGEAEVYIELNRPHPRLGSGLHYTLALARCHSDRERLPLWCDWLNERETQLAMGTSHIGAWHIAADARLSYSAFVPSCIGEALPNLPRDLLCGSVSRARAAMDALNGRLPL